MISITDHCIGMTATKIGQAMLLFTQADRIMERLFKGTGLGLPFAKLLVEGHGGSLQNTSEPGNCRKVTLRMLAEKKLSKNGRFKLADAESDRREAA